jgi:hypothetical protein
MTDQIHTTTYQLGTKHKVTAEGDGAGQISDNGEISDFYMPLSTSHLSLFQNIPYIARVCE